jgi:hypothetical protein
MPERPQTKFVVKLPKPLALSLWQWYQQAGGDRCSGITLPKFAMQVLETGIIEYRRRRLPPRTSPMYTRIDAGNQPALSEQQKEEMFELFDDDHCNVPRLAERFNVHSQTIRRLLEQTGRIHPRRRKKQLRISLLKKEKGDHET